MALSMQKKVSETVNLLERILKRIDSRLSSVPQDKRDSYLRSSAKREFNSRLSEIKRLAERNLDSNPLEGANELHRKVKDFHDKISALPVSLKLVRDEIAGNETKVSYSDQVSLKADTAAVQDSLKQLGTQTEQLKEQLKPVLPADNYSINCDSATSCTFPLKGPGGTEVSISIEHKPGSGGHSKSTNLFSPIVLGKLSCEDVKESTDTGTEFSFKLPADGSQVKVKYSCENVPRSKRIWCGEKKLTLKFGKTVMKEFTVKVFFPGLLPLNVSGTCLVQYQGPGENGYHHSADSHYGKQALLDKLYEVSRRFTHSYPAKVWKSAKAVRGDRKNMSWNMEGLPFSLKPYIPGEMRTFYEIKQPQVINYTDSTTVASLAGKDIEEQEMKIYINDMSLPSGGDFRIGNSILYEDIQSGHSSHDKGEDVDVSFNKLKYNFGGNENADGLEEQRLKLQELLIEVFGENYVDFHGSSDNRHWHCSLKVQRNKRRYTKKN
ncbi:penicillin-insensitive murein endopeptidase [bacterium]|nr:penicillin-insensitive murein endopeptidase [bacterium]